mmetsp:Transcript_28395/g.72727  ORF Transcript_28395/g.72727 Transcript_28395/m.72727 type:complete len:224 (-) Transcript_28395:868-1539(-)
MCHLVTHHRPHGAEVDSSVGVLVEEGGLEDGGREDNLVEVGMIVSIDLLWEHVPARFVRRCVGVRHRPSVPERIRSDDVTQVIAQDHLEIGVVDPLVGVADLVLEAVHLLKGFGPRARRHPLNLPQPRLERCAHLLHDAQSTRLRLAAEESSDVEFPDGLAEGVLDPCHRPLPAWLLLLLPRERLREEFKVGVGEGLRHVRRVPLRHLPSKVGLHVSARSLLE